MFARAAYIAELPWDEIRREYECEGATIADLCQKYCVASRTTLTRRRDREGWTRSVTETAAGMAPIVAAVAAMGEAGAEECQAPEPAAHAPAEAGPSVESTALEAPAAQERPPRPPRARRGARPETEAVEAERVIAPSEDVLQAAMDERARALIGRLSQVQADRVQRQLAIAEEVQQTGLRILRTIGRVFEPTNGDEAKEAEVQQAVLRLIRVNPDRETLAGLVKAAAEVTHKGITIERVALGMDIPARAPIGPVPEMPPSVADKPAIGLIQRLSYDAARQVRELALQLKRERDQRRTQSAAA